MGVPKMGSSPLQLDELDDCGQIYICSALLPSAAFTRLTVFVCFADSHLADPKSLALQYSFLEYPQPSCSSQSCKVARC